MKYWKPLKTLTFPAGVFLLKWRKSRLPGSSSPKMKANIDGHMLFGMTGRQCQTTMINGRILMKDRVLTEIDEEAVNDHILESSKRLWGRLNHKEY